MPTPELLVSTPSPDVARCLTWNLLDGGLDHEGDPVRLTDQLNIVADYAPDIVCFCEATNWHRNQAATLQLVCRTLNMKVASFALSQVGNGSNHTALLYNPDRLELARQAEQRGWQTFHHALIRAVFRPLGAQHDRADFLVLATHLSPFSGDARLNEARWMTDHGGEFPGFPPRAVLLGDLNTPDREPATWDDVPRNLHSRYRLVGPDGAFGKADRRALRVLLQSGWQDPHQLLGVTRPPTVGFYYPNEQVPWALDYALTAGLDVRQVFTRPWDAEFDLSDHLPTGVDVVLPS